MSADRIAFKDDDFNEGIDDDVHIKTGCCGRSCPLIGRLTGPRHDMELTRSLSSMRKIIRRRRIGETMKTMILILSIGCFFDTYTRRLPWSFNLLLDVFPVPCHIV